MTCEQFYNNIRGDYSRIKGLLPSDEIIIRFVKLFAEDTAFDELLEAVKNEDIKSSFEVAHKLKGISANLAFSELYESTNALTEQLRSQKEPADPSLVKSVKQSYRAVIREINNLKDGEA